MIVRFGVGLVLILFKILIVENFVVVIEKCLELGI